jgi:CheY-like chemotaxis protein
MLQPKDFLPKGKQAMLLQYIKTVLLVDDDFPLANGLRTALERSGMTVHHTANGRLALQWLAQNDADLVITDIFMDEMDGMEMVTNLKSDYPHIKIIAMSGGSRVVNLDCLPIAKALGANRILPKPARVEILLQLITELDEECAA